MVIGSTWALKKKKSRNRIAQIILFQKVRPLEMASQQDLITNGCEIFEYSEFAYANLNLLSVTFC